MHKILKNIPHLKDDLIAGITVALVLVPQSLAYAKLAGLPPHYGLYAALLPPVIAALFSSSSALATGPVAVLSLMTLAALSPIATPGSAEYISYAILLAFMVGAFMFALGILKLGKFVNFLSHPVIYGFTNAAAIIIATTQLTTLLGLDVERQERHYQTLWLVMQKAFEGVNQPTFILSVVALAAMFVLKKVNRKIPYILTVVALSTIASWFFKLPVDIVGTIPTGFPSVSMPIFDYSLMKQLLLPVITMALIGFTESVSVAQAIAVKTKQKISPNKELIGQGLANIIGSFTQSFPTTGSLSRTALNFQAGAKTWRSNMFASVFILITLLFFTPLLYYLPQAVLAVTIVLSVSGLIDFKRIKYIWYVNKYDAFAALMTFFGTLYFAPDLEVGILLGVLFSIGHFVYRNTYPRVAFLSMYEDRHLHDYKTFHLDQCENIAVVRLDAPLFFANAEYFEEETIKYLADHKHIHFILFVGNGINEIDATGEEMLSEFIKVLMKSSKKVYFAAMKAPVMDVFKRTGLDEEIGKDHFFQNVNQAIDFLLEKAEHKHQDKQECPLIKYVKSPIEHMHSQRSKRELVAYFYSKLLGKGYRTL